MVIGSTTCYTTHGWYHDGMSIHGLGVSHPKDPTCGLKGGSLGKSPLGEFLLGESLGCLPFDGWWLKCLGK